MQLSRCTTVGDINKRALRRLPAFAKAFLESGTGDDNCRDRNLFRFGEERLIPRYLELRRSPDTGAKLFGHDYKAPFAVAPIGMASVIWPGTERALASTAKSFGVPFCLSTVANMTIEEAGKILGPSCWFQLYPIKDPGIQLDLLKRCQSVGIETLIVTVDVPVHNPREGMRRAGLSMPLRITPSLVRQAVLAPSWSLATLAAGTPCPLNLERYIAGGAPPDKDQSFRFLSEQFGHPTTVQHLQTIREAWPGRLIVKGVLSINDARAAFAAHSDGIVVSNHGGRQLDAAQHPLDVIGSIRDIAPPAKVIALDSGVRSGSDIAVAITRGADFVLVGRPFLYGAAAGLGGPDKVASILTKGLENVMAQIGAETLQDLTTWEQL